MENNVLNYGPRMSKKRAAAYGVLQGSKDILAGDGGLFTTYAEVPNEEEQEINNNEEEVEEEQEHGIICQLIMVINKLVDILAYR